MEVQFYNELVRYKIEVVVVGECCSPTFLIGECLPFLVS